MTKKHIYLHSSNIEITKYIKDSENFRYPFEYNSIFITKTFFNEYGMFDTDNYYHIMIGNLPQKGCPWCDGEVEITDLIPDKFHLRKCIKCKKCGSQGPILNINEYMTKENNFEMMKWINEFMWNRYENRKQWDFDFVNPHENEKLT